MCLPLSIVWLYFLKPFLGQHQVKQLHKKVHEAPVGMLISPAILAIMIIGIFIFPNQFAQHFLQPAWIAVLPTLAKTETLNIEISAWHGFNTELLMTIGVVIFGILLYISMAKWLRIYRLYPPALTLNNLYEIVLDKMEKYSLAITRGYMTGSVRDYLAYIFTFLLLVVGGALYLFGGISFDFASNSPVNSYELALLFAMIVSALTILFAQSRLTAIIALGALGFFVIFFFVIFRAPDLALTQLVVETVTTVLFLLCFYHLPKLTKENSPLRFKTVNGLISIGVGCVVTVAALSAQGNRLFHSISDFYKNAYELAGAKNIVNAILVDFRGFDTMLEILVLSMAGLGVYTLIKMRLAGRENHERTK